MTRYAASPCVTAEMTWQVWMTATLGNRSAATPPMRRKTKVAVTRAAMTCPRASAEPVMWRTAKAMATVTIADPACETVRAAKYHAKRRRRSGARECAKVTVSLHATYSRQAQV